MSMSNEPRETDGLVLKATDRSIPVRLECGPGLTKQSFKDECDINKILVKYEKTGLLEHKNRYEGKYADVTGVVDYQTALNIVQDAEEAFMSLPARVRTEFDNNPHEFLEFAQNPENEDALIEMGLANPKRLTAEEIDEMAVTAAVAAAETHPAAEPGGSEADAKPA